MFFNTIELNKRINTLENENDMLKEIIKDELYKDFIEKLGEPDAFAKMKIENKRLRLKVKELQDKLIESETKPRRKR